MLDFFCLEKRSLDLFFSSFNQLIFDFFSVYIHGDDIYIII